MNVSSLASLKKNPNDFQRISTVYLCIKAISDYIKE